VALRSRRPRALQRPSPARAGRGRHGAGAGVGGGDGRVAVHRPRGGRARSRRWDRPGGGGGAGGAAGPLRPDHRQGARRSSPRGARPPRRRPARRVIMAGCGSRPPRTCGNGWIPTVLGVPVPGRPARAVLEPPSRARHPHGQTGAEDPRLLADPARRAGVPAAALLHLDWSQARHEPAGDPLLALRGRPLAPSPTGTWTATIRAAVR
jgi:hypothetical protein